MSSIYAVYSRKKIDEELFERTLRNAGGTVADSSDRHSIREGYLAEDGVGSVSIYLRRHPMLELHEDEDKQLFTVLGGKPVSKIGIEPGKEANLLLIKYLAALADELDYVVTNFDEVLMTGIDVQEKQKLGWVTLNPAAPGREFG